MFSGIGQVERELDRVHAQTQGQRAPQAPPERGPEPLVPLGPGTPGPATERLLRRAYGLKDAPRGSRAEKVIGGAKIVGGGVVLGLTMLGGLYLSRRIEEWRKPESERKPVAFLAFDWETMVPLVIAIALGAASVWALRKLFEEEAAPALSNGGGGLPMMQTTSRPQPPDLLDQMLAQAEASLAAASGDAPPMPALGT